jgi:hypothetical protein
MGDMTPRPNGIGHNRGPALDDYTGPPWGDGDPYSYLCWARARRSAWRNVSMEVTLRRLEKAERLGLSYREYTLEIMERGRYLQIEDVARVAEIKKARVDQSEDS